MCIEALEIIPDPYLKQAENACQSQMEGRITIPLAVKLLLFVLEFFVIVMASFLCEWFIVFLSSLKYSRIVEKYH